MRFALIGDHVAPAERRAAGSALHADTQTDRAALALELRATVLRGAKVSRALRPLGPGLLVDMLASRRLAGRRPAAGQPRVGAVISFKMHAVGERGARGAADGARSAVAL